MKGDINVMHALMASLIVGVVIAFIGAIPVLRLPNICCLWIILGGFITAYLVGRSAKTFELVDAAIVGGIFGFVYGFMVNILTFLVNIILNILGLGLNVRGVDSGGVLKILGIHLGFDMVGGLVLIIFNVILGVIFGGIGGLIYAAAIGEIKMKSDESKDKMRSNSSYSEGKLGNR